MTMMVPKLLLCFFAVLLPVSEAARPLFEGRRRPLLAKAALVTNDKPALVKWKESPLDLSESSSSLAMTAMNIPRGGGGIGAISKADVVQFHAYNNLMFGACFLLASFGIDVPVLGPASAVPGWDSNNNGAIRILGCFASGLLFAGGMMELEFYSSPTMHNIYTMYHLVLAVLVTYTTNQVATSKEHWLYPIALTFFLIGGLIGK